MKKSCTILLETKEGYVPVFNLASSDDGSIMLTDLIKRHAENDLAYEICTFDYPIHKKTLKQQVTPHPVRYYSKQQLKFSHHASGFFQVSGDSGKSILSGIDSFGHPRGVATNSFKLSSSTNDGGPIIGTLVWGLDKLPAKSSKKQTELLFTEDEMQELHDELTHPSGKKKAFILDFFHIPAAIVSEEEKAKGSMLYKNWGNNDGLRLKLIDISEHNFFVGVLATTTRTNMDSLFGFTMTGGPSAINLKEGACKNTCILFPMPNYKKNLDHLSLDNK